ncbi:adenylylsulfate kinase [Flavobacteriaceae bacterium MAR_2010_188]|nr:adenylylsulfate kinase [Flavobacteriaceae bacterium MAR_2010_188]
MSTAENISKHSYNLERIHREKLNNHKSLLLWFTGLSGSGKSTIANEVEKRLHNMEIRTYTLDGDNVRKGINKDLSFSPEDRTENIRRIAETSNLMLDAGIVVLAAFVSPYKKDRDGIRSVVKDVNFVEIFVNTSLAECEKRDVKGLYEKARKGEIKNMTGISAPYEQPTNPEIEIITEGLSIEEAAELVVSYVLPKIKLL